MSARILCRIFYLPLQHARALAQATTWKPRQLEGAPPCTEAHCFAGRAGRNTMMGTHALEAGPCLSHLFGAAIAITIPDTASLAPISLNTTRTKEERERKTFDQKMTNGRRAKGETREIAWLEVTLSRNCSRSTGQRTLRTACLVRTRRTSQIRILFNKGSSD